MILKINFGDLPDLPDFARADHFFRAAELVADFELNLDKNKLVLVSSDNIDFAESGAKVGINDLESFFNQVFPGDFFSPPACLKIQDFHQLRRLF